MTAAHILPLQDPSTEPSSWNERMAAGEYAVHPSSYDDPSATPHCYVFPTLADAVQYAEQQAAIRPAARFRIYDHNGFIGAPIREIRGMNYRENDISARFRRWAGSILFFGGIALTLTDWSVDFRYFWPAALGTRMLMPGAVLLFTEAMVMLYARRARAHKTASG